MPTVFPPINTGGSFRVHEMAYSPSANLVLAANNVDNPAFGTLVNASTGERFETEMFSSSQPRQVSVVANQWKQLGVQVTETVIPPARSGDRSDARRATSGADSQAGDIRGDCSSTAENADVA